MGWVFYFTAYFSEETALTYLNLTEIVCMFVYVRMNASDERSVVCVVCMCAFKSACLSHQTISIVKGVWGTKTDSLFYHQH